MFCLTCFIKELIKISINAEQHIKQEQFDKQAEEH